MQFTTKCCQIAAVAVLYHCSVTEFEETAIFHNSQWQHWLYRTYKIEGKVKKIENVLCVYPSRA